MLKEKSMVKWHVSEFSKLTGVSVRTLHHYDSINLLKASERQPNGFRLYSEKDLQFLMRILSLKFLGFELSTIKEILDGAASVPHTFTYQQKAISQNLKKLYYVDKILKTLEPAFNKITLDQVLKIIGIYRLLDQLNSPTSKINIHSKIIDEIDAQIQEMISIVQKSPELSLEAYTDLCKKTINEISAINHPDAEFIKVFLNTDKN